MNRRMVKQECYLDMLEEAINSVESVLNYIDRIKDKVGVFNDDILQKDAIRAQFDLELALASLSILLRKMAENNFIEIDSETRRDINSIIHSNKFEVEDGKVIVYSQKGEELVNIDNLLSFARSILESTNMFHHSCYDNKGDENGL